MAKWKRTKKSLIATAVSTGLCLALLIGTTLAWFSDNTANARNKIVAGNLDVALYNVTDGGKTPVAGDTALFGEDPLWEPGEARWVNLQVENTGTLALQYWLRSYVAEETGSTNVFGTDFCLSEHMYCAIVEGIHTYATWEEAVQAAQAAGALPLSGGSMSYGGHLRPVSDNEDVSSTAQVTLIVYMAQDDQNAANAREDAPAPTVDLGIALTAAQDTGESDSFDDQYDAELLTSVSIKGIAGLEGRTFATIQEAYAAGNAVVSTLGLGEETATDEAFDAIYTDGGKITWTICGPQILENDTSILTFGRASNRYSRTRSIHEIDVVGANASAQLHMENVGLPYAWWSEQEDALTVNFRNLDLVATGSGQITCSRSYGLLTVNFDHCDVEGRIYHYFQNKGTISITNCNFTDDGTNGYAFFVQGGTSEPLTVHFANNTVVGYTRGINIQQKLAEVTIQNNRIISTDSEPDRGAIQLTDAANCLVEGNVIEVNGGNAFWFHEAATNDTVQYTIINNTITAPYLINDDTSFGISSHIISSGNTVQVKYPGQCMEKDALEASSCDITLG